MHPSQMGAFRKTVIVLLTITFAGALLLFTAQANLDLLKSVYPDPKFYMFGLLALEGGVVYWTGYYLLHLAGVHKALAVFALAVDAILSGVGFFYEMERMTSAVGTVSLPPIIVVVGFAVVFNVGMSLITHLIPSGSKPSVQIGMGDYYPMPKPTTVHAGEQQHTLSQTAQIQEVPSGPSPLALMWAGMTSPLMERGRKEMETRSRRNHHQEVIHQEMEAE